MKGATSKNIKSQNRVKITLFELKKAFEYVLGFKSLKNLLNTDMTYTREINRVFTNFLISKGFILVHVVILSIHKGLL